MFHVPSKMGEKGKYPISNNSVLRKSSPYHYSAAS